MNLNKVMLAGRLTRDPELRYTPKGTPVVEFGLAINRTTKTTEETTFLDIILWDRQAEVAGQYLKKGSPVFIEGRIQLDTWTDKQTNQKRSRLRVVGENLQLLGGKPFSGEPGPSPSRPLPPRPAAAASQPLRPPAPAIEPDLEDDIPF